MAEELPKRAIDGKRHSSRVFPTANPFIPRDISSTTPAVYLLGQKHIGGFFIFSEMVAKSQMDLVKEGYLHVVCQTRIPMCPCALGGTNSELTAVPRFYTFFNDLCASFAAPVP